MKIPVGRSIQESAEEAARALRGRFAESGVLAVNLISSPGSGKTTLLEKLIGELRGKKRIAVIEGDLETEIDAARIRGHGVPAFQINTRSSCNIQPAMLLETVRQVDLPGTDLLFIENVGNLVCPAEVPLGEDLRAVALSVTEGDEKPLKYPLVFRTSDLLVITKIDLLPHVRFDLDRVRAVARAARPGIGIFETSAETGQGIAALASHLAALHDRKRG